MSTTINHEQFVIDGDYQTSVQKLEIVAAAVPAFTILGKKTNDGALSAADAVADGAGEAGANTGTGRWYLTRPPQYSLAQSRRLHPQVYLCRCS